MVKLTSVPSGKSVVISSFRGGTNFQGKLRAMGIREGKKVKVVVIQPMDGPVVIEIDNRKTSIGRRMAERILVELE